MPLLLTKLTILLAVLEEVQPLVSGVSASEAAQAVLHPILRSDGNTETWLYWKEPSVGPQR